MSEKLVKLRIRPSRDGKRFTYFLDYLDEKGKRQRPTLRHADKRKAERQRDQKERELRMGIVSPKSMRLSRFLEDSLERTGDQIKESTRKEYEAAMNDFIEVISNCDFQKVTLDHGELFRQKCLDKGNSKATVAKKLRHLKRLFQLAVRRKQLDENPLRYIEMPKSPKKKVEIYTLRECERILKAAGDCQENTEVRWDLLVMVSLVTAMRKSELLNTTLDDIDFETQTIEVSPKKDTAQTWKWDIKDTDRRTLPLTDEITAMLIDRVNGLPEGYPYVFVPPARYDYIQNLRSKGNWTFCDARLKVINNFTRQFDKILERASVRHGKFHDLRRTAITNWFANGMSEYDVMTLAGHASFTTTHEFYLAVADDLVDRARLASVQGLGQDLARIWHAPDFRKATKKAVKHKCLTANVLSDGQRRT